MANFRVKTAGLKAGEEEINQVAAALSDKGERVSCVRQNLQQDSFWQVNVCLKSISQELLVLSKSTRILGKGLEEAAYLYEQAEDRLLGEMEAADSILLGNTYGNNVVKKLINAIRNYFIKKKQLTKEDIDSIVFSEEGQYGGNQGSPEIQTRERKEELYDIIRRNRAGENLPDDLEPYLKKINNEGCGYVALTNSIFRYFENRSEEFQKAFGYSMYDKNGNLNFDMLLVDLYSSKDNIDPVTNIRNNMLDYNKEQDSYLNPYDPWKDVTGKGTTPAERKYYMETFLAEHGIKGTIDVQEEMSISQIEERLQRGEDVIISYRNGNIYREDGSIQQQIIGGHAMTITGVTKEGYYIVSSWGEKFYIHPDERIEFEEGQVTSMRYSIVSYS